MRDIIELYANYIHALRYTEEYSNLFNDDKELRVFEKQLLEYHIKIMTKEGKCEYEKVKIKEFRIK